MTKADELNALADRCEREEASSELNNAIARFFAGNFYDWWKNRPGGTDFTNSLDAAVRPEGDDVFWRSGHDGEGPDPSLFKAEVLVVRDNGSRSSFGCARTEPMARRAAELRARAALLDDGADK